MEYKFSQWIYCSIDITNIARMLLSKKYGYTIEFDKGKYVNITGTIFTDKPIKPNIIDKINKISGISLTEKVK